MLHPASPEEGRVVPALDPRYVIILSLPRRVPRKGPTVVNMMMMIVMMMMMMVVDDINQPSIIIPILHANCIVICEPERANCVGLILYRSHAHCILRVASASGASCNCIPLWLLLLCHTISFNSRSLKLTVYCVCEAAKPNSQCLLYFNNSSNQISVKIPFQWYQYHNFR